MLDHICHLLFMMAAAHAYADFALQDPWHSGVKYPGNGAGYPWRVALACHGLIHGGLVALITGHWWIGVMETVAHTAIDYGKSRKCYGSTSDQLAHIVCKIIWIVIAINA